jgi:hypothetical protein
MNEAAMLFEETLCQKVCSKALETVSVAEARSHGCRLSKHRFEAWMNERLDGLNEWTSALRWKRMNGLVECLKIKNKTA